MESISLVDGLVLTVVSMLVVFAVLTAIWFLIELVSKLIGDSPIEAAHTPTIIPAQTVEQPAVLTENQEYKLVAEIMALILAAEDEPNRKFEIVETKRIK